RAAGALQPTDPRHVRADRAVPRVHYLRRAAGRVPARRAPGGRRRRSPGAAGRGQSTGSVRRHRLARGPVADVLADGAARPRHAGVRRRHRRPVDPQALLLDPRAPRGGRLGARHAGLHCALAAMTNLEIGLAGVIVLLAAMFARIPIAVSLAAFGAICGSSIATAATFSKVAIPEMRRHGYNDIVAAGSVAAAGTLGILIPPSVILAVYSLVAEQSLAKLFAAALFPGILLAALYVVAVVIQARLRPQWMPRVPPMPLRERLRAARGMWKLVLLFFFAVVGIYLGWFSPTEGAAISA